MDFYKNQHKYYCGIDLHARKMYVCILNNKGKVLVHQNIKTDPELFFEIIFPYIDDVAVGVECVFCWYWLADLCAAHKITFVLGHALYMKAIHGGKTKNDKIDSYKIALLLKGGNFPTTYTYPAMARHPGLVTTPNVSLKTLFGTGCPYPEYQYTIQFARL